MENLVACAVLKAYAGVSAPDYAVGKRAGVRKGGSRPSRAASASARLGTSEISWIRRCYLCMRCNGCVRDVILFGLP